MEMAHGRWGRLKWSRLFKPAIKLADDGFEITPALRKRLEQMKVALRDFPAIRAHYYDASGAPKPVGARIKNPELARLLKRSEEHTSELQSLMRISYAVFCLKKKKTNEHRILLNITKHKL